MKTASIMKLSCFISVITGEKSIQEVGEEIVDYIIELASGNVETKADQLKQDVFIPWKRGVSL